MNRSKLRRQIAWEAARLMYARQESEYYTAKKKAARQICKGWVKPADLPSNVEIRDQIQLMARMFEGAARTDNLLAMRLAALAMMRRLAPFRPRLIGSVLTGHVRQGSDIDLHVFSDTVEAVTHLLDQDGINYIVERKQVCKHGEERIFTHVHLVDGFSFELTIYAADQAHYTFKSSITGKAIERASIAELEQFLESEYPELDLAAAEEEAASQIDRFQLFESLLLPLENVKGPLAYHPEGDMLYHSLQVFDHARDNLAYDEEFLTAALLHDVGKAIDASDHVTVALEALDGFITDRTAWLIEHHMLAHQLADGKLGARARRRLEQSEHFDDLILLGDCDRAGRQAGVEAPELDEALDYLRELAKMFS
ncbi:MAG TPA: HD domain-containing protein [Lacipirellulaceae bacterium]|nr:HD domain-containing protein [Lacipirellulaceae bacterium]